MLLKDAPAHLVPSLLDEGRRKDRINVVTKRAFELDQTCRAYLGAEGADIEGELGNLESWPLRLRHLKDIKAIDEPTYQDLLKVTDAPNILGDCAGCSGGRGN